MPNLVQLDLISRNSAAVNTARPVTDELILSLFPGIGLLDTGFEQAGFCVVRGPDVIFGGDIRRFNPPSGRFDGVIGGPPCTDHSRARRGLPPSGIGEEMRLEFMRCVIEAEPEWWLLENVDTYPDVEIGGYSHQRLDLWAHDFGLSQRRLRHIQFGSRSGDVIVIERSGIGGIEPTVTASEDNRPWSKIVELQGLPKGYDIPPFTEAAKRRAIGNGVPVPMANALARAVRDRVPADTVRLCQCSCGRPVAGRKTYAGSACRMRAMRKRKA